MRFVSIFGEFARRFVKKHQKWASCRFLFYCSIFDNFKVCCFTYAALNLSSSFSKSKPSIVHCRMTTYFQLHYFCNTLLGYKKSGYFWYWFKLLLQWNCHAHSHRLFLNKFIPYLPGLSVSRDAFSNASDFVRSFIAVLSCCFNFDCLSARAVANCFCTILYLLKILNCHNCLMWILFAFCIKLVVLYCMIKSMIDTIYKLVSQLWIQIMVPSGSKVGSQVCSYFTRSFFSTKEKCLGLCRGSIVIWVALNISRNSYYCMLVSFVFSFDCEPTFLKTKHR